MLKITKLNDFKPVAAFIAGLNTDQQYHVGFCGTNREEIFHTLLHAFSDLPLESSFVAAFENKKIIGVIGLDIDEDTKEAELWGPFILHEEWDQVALMMWGKLLEQLPISLSKVHGFFNIHNKNCRQFMERLLADEGREDSILKISRINHQQSTPDKAIIISEMTEASFESFKVLHQESFPNAYYTAEEIYHKTDHENKVFIATANNELHGYVYSEANPKFQEGDIHFIAVSYASRNNGIGKKLVNRSLDFMFSFEELDEITLCVDSSNQAAIKIYLKAGFTELHKLVSYELTFEHS